LLGEFVVDFHFARRCNDFHRHIEGIVAACERFGLDNSEASCTGGGDDGGEWVAAELTSAAEGEPRFFVTGGHNAGHRPTPFEDDKLLPGLADLIEEAKALGLEGSGCDFHVTTVHDHCTRGKAR
jgi:hypothetical protein